jgi:hypothetical protein
LFLKLRDIDSEPVCPLNLPLVCFYQMLLCLSNRAQSICKSLLAQFDLLLFSQLDAFCLHSLGLESWLD